MTTRTVRLAERSAGAVLVTAGLALAWGQESMLRHGSLLLTSAGFLLVVWPCIRRHLVPAEEAYRQGYDKGHEDGFREGRRTIRPVVVGLHRRAVSHARGVADRG